MGRGTIYPEDWDYAWLDDYDRVMKDSKFVSGNRLVSETPPAPLWLVLKLMEEMASYQEIFEAFASAKPDEQIPMKERNLIFVFLDYMRHKYGNETDATHVAMLFMRFLANGKYTGIEDPTLRRDLLNLPNVYEDRSKLI